MSTNERASRRRRILLVEDNATIREMVARQLERAGYTVITARDAKAAIDILRTMPAMHPKDADAFDMVITDHQMPGGDGIVVVTYLRSVGFTGKIAVHCSEPGPQARGFYEQQGIREDQFILKPVGISDIIRQVAKIFGD